MKTASRYLFDAHGLKIAKRTLTNLRVSGTGPLFRRVGRYVVYGKADLDAYAASRISAKQRSSREAVELVRPPRTEAEAEALSRSIEDRIAALNAWVGKRQATAGKDIATA